MARPKNDILQGTLALLVLKTLASGGRMHGYAITAHIQRISADLLRVEEGSLYPALYRLEGAGEVKAVWEDQPHGRRGARRRFYRLTAKGRRKLGAGRAEWQQFVRILGGILGAPA